MIQVINKYGQLKTITISITSSGVTDVTASLPILSTGGATPNISLGINSITNSYFRQSSGLSIVGRSVNSVGNVADIIASTNYTILRRTGTSIGFGTLVAEHLNPTYTNGYVLSTDGSGNLSWIASVGTPSHNSLSGLQGGTPTEYYHLTAAQHTVAIQAASSTLNGYLTSTDWTTFNSKQNALGFTPEDVSNKATDLTSPDNTKYPTTQAIVNELNLYEKFLISKPVGVYGTVTGTTAETVILSIPFSGGDFEIGDYLGFDIWTKKSVFTAITNITVRAGTTGTTADNVLSLLQHHIGGQSSAASRRDGIIFETGNFINGRTRPIVNAISIDVGSFVTATRFSLDPSAPWFLTFTVTHSSASDEISVTTYSVSKRKSF